MIHSRNSEINIKTEAREIPELYKAGDKVELPGAAAVEVRFRAYRRNECGRDFSEEDLNNS